MTSNQNSMSDNHDVRCITLTDNLTQRRCEMAKKTETYDRHNLVCKLTKCIVTEDGDFIPKGTKVSVIGWDQDNKGKILVKTYVYMYADDMGEDKNGPIPAVMSGLIVSVKPTSLVFDSYDKGRGS